MGLLDDILNVGKDLLKREATKMLKGDRARSGRGSSTGSAPRKRKSTRKSTRSSNRLPDDARWCGPGQAFRIHGFAVGPFVYVGTRLTRMGGRAPDPCLINPKLQAVAGKATAVRGRLDYAKLTPQQRYSYLNWIAAGRRDPDIDLAFPRLYLFGLERRVLGQLANSAASRSVLDEIRDIRTELHGLLRTYGDGIREDTTPLADAIAVLFQIGEPITAVDPELASGLPLELMLASAAARGEALSAELAWAWSRSSRQPAVVRRHPDLARQVFQAYFGRDLAGKLTLEPTRGGAESLFIKPRNPGVTQRRVDTSAFPSYADSYGSADRIDGVLDAIATDLAPYDRLIRAESFDGNTLAHLATIPAPAFDQAQPRVVAFRDWLNHQVTKPYGTPVPAKLLLHEWDSELVKPTPTITAQLADFLARMGFGLQPDRRMAWEAIDPDERVVLFRMPHPLPDERSAETTAALVQLQFAAAIAMADGRMTQPELNEITAFIEGAKLHASERGHLYARLIFVCLQPVKLTGMTRMIADLSEDTITRITEFLIILAACNGAVSGEQMDVLSKIWKLLGRDESSISSRIHAAMTSVPTANRPTLDPERVARTQQETAVISDLLGKIFTDEEPETIAPPPPAENGIGSLTAAQSALLRQVIGQEHWTEDAFAAAASALGLMPNGAQEAINQHALDTCGEPLLEPEGNGWALNTWAREQLKL